MELQKISIGSYVVDLINAETEALAPLKRQIEDEAVNRYPNACVFISDALLVLGDQVEALRAHLDEIDGASIELGVDSGADAMDGMSFHESDRSMPVSRQLKGDHAVLSRLCLCYETLHTSALATHNYSTAALALRHLEELATTSMECSRVIPGIVVRELLERDSSVDGSVVEEAERNIHRTWKSGARLEYQKENHKQFAASV